MATAIVGMCQSALGNCVCNGALEEGLIAPSDLIKTCSRAVSCAMAYKLVQEAHSWVVSCAGGGIVIF